MEAYPMGWRRNANPARGAVAGQGHARRSAAAKRAFDLVGAGLALALVLPLLLALLLAVRLSDGGPALYRQRRAGLRGRPFVLLKIRTMTVDAPRAPAGPGPVPRQAAPGDPRVTPLGRWLRRTSLDELPQLWNVLRGEMSLVGPRPHALGHDAYYGARIPAYAARRRAKPGLTGWAQVNGLRGPTPTLARMEARVRLDLDYLARRSLALDLRIVALTPLRLTRADAC